MLDESETAGCQRQIDGCTWRTAKANQALQLLQVVLVGVAGGKDDVGYVLLNLLVEIDFTNHLASLLYLLSAHHRTDVQFLLLDILTDDCFFFLQTRIVDDHLQHETVHLSLRQRVCALLLNGVLRSQYEERLRKFISIGGDGHLTLLHGFEQCTLHLGWSTVDLICQNEVGEDRTFLCLELTIFLRVNHGTDDIGRQQVGCELDARELRINQRCQGFDGFCLCQTWHTFEQHVPIRKKSQKEGLHQMFLTDDGLIHACHQVCHKRRVALNFLV